MVKFEDVLKNELNAARTMVISPGAKSESRGYFTNFRVDRNTIPKDWYAYDIRTDCNGNFYTLEPNVLINHGGTFLTKKKLRFRRKWEDTNRPYFSLCNNKYGWTFE